MNHIIFAVLLFCVNVSFQNDFIYQDVKEATQVKMKVQISQLECRTRYPKVGQNLIDEAQKGQSSDSKELREYYLCYGKNIEFLQDGNLDLVKLKNWLNRLEHDPKAVDKAIEECKIDGEESEEKIFRFIICLAGKDVPVDVVGKDYIERVREEIDENHLACQDSSDLTESVISEAQKGHFPNIEALKVHYDCFAIHVRYLDAMFDLQPLILRDWLKNFLKYEATLVDKALDKCYKPENVKILELNFYIVKCLSEEGIHVDVIAS